jgi:MoaA/NifB/PqqE/SkfB family radical SAM enzyme
VGAVTSRRPDLADRVAAAVGDGRMGDRLWVYATYHCNLACSYCLTESSPSIAERRTLSAGQVLAAVDEALDLGLTRVGVTGGEVFMVAGIPELLVEVAERMPALVLTNAALFGPPMLDRLAQLASRDVAFQLSLDSMRAPTNDALRAPGNRDQVLAAIPALLARGLRVRIATTVEGQPAEELEEICAMHRSFGIPDSDHVVRPVVGRGRAAVRGMGEALREADVLPELTVTADGVFMHPFAPTVRGGRTDTDLLVAGPDASLAEAAGRFLDAVEQLPAGADVARNIR